MFMIRAAVLSLLIAAAAWAEPLKVAAAISLKDAITEIGKAYEADSGDKVEFTFGSSGQLMAQIKSGAPIDAFISAAHKQVDDLAGEGLVDPASRRVIAGNRLVLIAPPQGRVKLSAFQDLAKPGVQRVAIGEPKTVPAGQYAAAALGAMKLADALEGRLVYGANVRQVLDYVERGEVDAGIVYTTDARESGDKVRVVAAADSATHEPIVYPAVAVKASPRANAAKRFLGFLMSAKAQAILAKRGFAPVRVPVPATAPATAPAA